MHATSTAQNSVDGFINDPSKNVAIFVNDYYGEYAEALEMLSKALGRPLYGILLMDTEVKNRKHPEQDKFKEVVCDFSDVSALHRAVKPYEENLLLVSCSSERSQPDFERLLPHVPYVLGPTESSLEWTTHKDKMRELLTSYNSEFVPKVHVLDDASEKGIRTILRELTFPMIIKPAGLAGSLLVTKVDNEQALRMALEKSFEVIHDVYARDRGRGNPRMLVEEFIEGDLYTVDAYVNEVGKVWLLPYIRPTTARMVGRQGFYIFQEESNHTLTDEDIEEANDAAEQAVHAVGLRSSIAHIELFQTKNGWKIVELGPRPGGQRQEMYLLTYGVHHAYNELRIKVGLEPEIRTDYKQHSTAIALYADEEGPIAAIEGVEEARSNPAVYNLLIHAQPGDVARHSANGGKRLAEGVLHHSDLGRLNEQISHVRTGVKIVINE